MPAAVGVLLQKVVTVELLVHRLAAAVLVGHAARLVRVGEGILEHHLEQLRVGRVLHHALALQSARRLCGRELLGLAARRGGVLPALEAVRDAEDLPRLLVDVGEVEQLVLKVALEVVDANERLVRRRADVPALAVLGIGAQFGVVRQRDPRAGLHESVDDLLLDAVDGVLLVRDHVNIAVAEELAVYAHALLQNDGVKIRLVERHHRRLHHRVPVLVQPGRRAVDVIAERRFDRQKDLLVFLLLRRPVVRAAPRARPAVVALRLRLLRVHGDRVQRHAAGHFLGHQPAGDLLLGQLLRDQPAGKAARRVGQKVPLLRLRAEHLPAQRPDSAALPAHRLPPRLIVRQVQKLNVVHPLEAVDAAALVNLKADVERQAVVGLALAVRRADVRLALALVCEVHAVLPPDGLLRRRHLRDEPVHVADARINTRLRAELLRMQQRHRDLAHGGVCALRVVPLHEESRAALDRHRALGHVVDRLKGQAVQLIAQEVLDDVGEPLVLLPPRRHLRLRDGRGDLTFDVLEDDVAHMARFLRLSVALRVALDKRRERPAAVVALLALVHVGYFTFPLVVALLQSLLPERELFADFLFHVSLLFRPAP